MRQEAALVWSEVGHCEATEKTHNKVSQDWQCHCCVPPLCHQHYSLANHHHHYHHRCCLELQGSFSLHKTAMHGGSVCPTTGYRKVSLVLVTVGVRGQDTKSCSRRKLCCARGMEMLPCPATKKWRVEIVCGWQDTDDKVRRPSDTQVRYSGN